jgi:aryl-alcohol dehydrogenase-like predicted oxidoreductase
MEQRPFGHHSFRVSALGLGAGEVGDGAIDDSAADRLLHGALDAGITLVDTARGYGLSEERIGRHLAHRRDEFILSTKVGYGVPGMPDWTYDTVLSGVEQACRTMRTERIDIVHLHSCPLGTLRDAGVIDALEEAVRRGLVRVPAYSGENEDLAFAFGTGRFGSLQMSVNVFDQRSAGGIVPEAAGRGMGVIAKRPLGNAPWRFESRPSGHYCEEYWVRWKQMGITADMPWDEFALRFVASLPGISSLIAGTANLEHLQRNCRLVERGPLSQEEVQRVRAAFQANDRDWRGQV